MVSYAVVAALAQLLVPHPARLGQLMEQELTADVLRVVVWLVVSLPPTALRVCVPLWFEKRLLELVAPWQDLRRPSRL